MSKYSFYGSNNAAIKSIHPVMGQYEGIDNPLELYDALLHLWRADTCAPRMRAEWTESNPTLGQCSITAFLAQDIFGGRVYGILRPGGNYHCYNVVDAVAFDLTSEQFRDERLDYADNPEQFREVHFQKAEKRERYELLRERLEGYLTRAAPPGK